MGPGLNAYVPYAYIVGTAATIAPFCKLTSAAQKICNLCNLQEEERGGPRGREIEIGGKP